MNIATDKITSRLPTRQFSEIAGKLRKYLWLIILVFFALIYSLMMYKLNSFTSEQPSSEQIGTYLKVVNQPAINSKVVQQLQALNNNSGSVKALFDQNRQNPFQ